MSLRLLFQLGGQRIYYYCFRLAMTLVMMYFLVVPHYRHHVNSYTAVTANGIALQRTDLLLYSVSFILSFSAAGCHYQIQVAHY